MSNDAPSALRNGDSRTGSTPPPATGRYPGRGERGRHRGARTGHGRASPAGRPRRRAGRRAGGPAHARRDPGPRRPRDDEAAAGRIGDGPRRGGAAGRRTDADGDPARDRGPAIRRGRDRDEGRSRAAAGRARAGRRVDPPGGAGARARRPGGCGVAGLARARRDGALAGADAANAATMARTLDRLANDVRRLAALARSAALPPAQRVEEAERAAATAICELRAPSAAGRDDRRSLIFGVSPHWPSGPVTTGCTGPDCVDEAGLCPAGRERSKEPLPGFHRTENRGGAP